MGLQSTAQVVIGAQFGDEGKGRMIDAYAASVGRDGLVIRFNGGAQAGHTVVTPAGLRHVFSHIGSGALVGAATFLSRFFITHPILFCKEIESLQKKGLDPTVYVDPGSPVTTPYDMLLNQLIEQERGANRHGSCGIGFGETIERHLTSAYRLTVADLTDRVLLIARLEAIRREYAPARLLRLGLGAALARNADRFGSEAILERFLEDIQQFLQGTTVTGLTEASHGRHLLFEGAQGLLLAQDCAFFPHVTRSNTGLRNVLTIAAELDLRTLAVTYVTRPYLTRHGAGPLPHELPEKPYVGIVDATNLPNEWQGALRFGWLDLDRLQEAIVRDLAEAAGLAKTNIRARLAMTCLDQIGDEKLTYVSNGAQRQVSVAAFSAIVTETMRQVRVNDCRFFQSKMRSTH